MWKSRYCKGESSSVLEVVETTLYMCCERHGCWLHIPNSTLTWIRTLPSYAKMAFTVHDRRSGQLNLILSLIVMANLVITVRFLPSMVTQAGVLL